MRRAIIYSFLLALAFVIASWFMVAADHAGGAGLRRSTVIVLVIACAAVVALAYMLYRAGAEHRRIFLDGVAKVVGGGLLLLLFGGVTAYWNDHRSHRAGFQRWVHTVCDPPTRVEKSTFAESRCYFCKASTVPDEYGNDVLAYGGASAFAQGVEVCTDDF